MADLTALTSRVATLEAANANTTTSLHAIDTAIADLDNRADALAARIVVLEQRAAAARAALPALDAAIAKIATTAPKTRIALGYARDAIAKTVGA